MELPIPISQLQPYLPFLILALGGAGVRFILAPGEKSLLSFFCNMLVGVFTGVILYCFTSSFNAEMRTGLVGLASYCGGDLLAVFSRILKKKVETEGGL